MKTKQEIGKMFVDLHRTNPDGPYTEVSEEVYADTHNALRLEDLQELRKWAEGKVSSRDNCDNDCLRCNMRDSLAVELISHLDSCIKEVTE